VTVLDNKRARGSGPQRRELAGPCGGDRRLPSQPLPYWQNLVATAVGQQRASSGSGGVERVDWIGRPSVCQVRASRVRLEGSPPERF